VDTPAGWREYPDRRVLARREKIRRSIGRWPGEWDPVARAVRALDTQQRGARAAVLFAHLARVWNTCREATVREASGRPEVADLVMATKLAGHVVGCAVCSGDGPDGGRGAAWMLWACAKRRGLRMVIGAVVAEVAGVRMPRAWEVDLPGDEDWTAVASSG
jgi:hypothetical protein